MDPRCKCEIRTKSKVFKIGPGVWFGVQPALYIAHFSHKPILYTKKNRQIYIFLPTIVSYAKELITDNCDRANTFSRLFCYIAMNINLGCTSQFKGMGTNE